MIGARLKYIAIGLLLLSRGGMEAQSSAAMPSEYQVKAAFLYNFVKFVDWPGQRAGEVELCVIGRDPFGGALERAVEGKSLGGRAFTVRHITDPAAARSCQALFVGVSEAKRAAEIVESTRPWGVLTVSDIEGFLNRGGMIAFETEGQRVRFRINVTAASGAGLRISSKLLQLATGRGDGR
jgi:hypothetical protein